MRQGGILSTCLYKTFIDDLLYILENKRLGFGIGTVFAGSTACFVTKSGDELQLMFNEGKDYSGRHRYEIHPIKTNIVDLVNGDNVNTDMTLSLGENVVSFSDTATHPGITRTGQKKNLSSMLNRESRQQEEPLTHL